MWVIANDDCLTALKSMPDNSIDSVVTDPPYELGFMGKKWDASGIAYSVDLWTEALRVLKPGGYLLAFGGTRTYHRMVCAIEDAGFEIRDSLHWIYGSGFPKSHDISKAIDKAAGAEREVIGRSKYADKGRTLTNKVYSQATASDQEVVTAPATEAAKEYEGWGTALKPAHEPIVMARKPLSGKTVAANVLKYGTGGINIDGCRIATDDNPNGGAYSGELRQREEYSSSDSNSNAVALSSLNRGIGDYSPPVGRWPANIILSGDAVDELDKQKVIGGASRFFYHAKASKSERPVVDGVAHPTVKPLALMRWLVRLVTPVGGTVLDPFAGSGTTAEACELEGFNSVMMEREATYIKLINARMEKYERRAA